MKYLIWAAILLSQSASYTWVSRARNSGSLGYHAIAAFFSHTTWFIGQWLLLDELLRILKTGDWSQVIPLGVFYTTFMMLGSVWMHWLSLKYLEVGRRKVGA
jgi:hypothetical protein